jgi:hypothetical protein
VASYCAKCGSEVPADKQFCATCGAPVGTVPAPVGVAPAGVGLAPAVVAPVPPPVAPPASGGSALKIILIVVAVFVGLGILGAGAFGFMVWRVAHSFHASGTNGQFSVDTPGGTISANNEQNFSASDLGTDIYPGAQPGKGSMRMNIAGTSMVSAVYVTPDSKDQVVSFYKSKFGGDASVFDNASSAIVSVNKSKQESVMVTISVNASQYDGKTQIHIVHSTNSRAN